ncbi:MAG: hypothetical protein QM756_32415 [Polyangiaceae bacterium]
MTVQSRISKSLLAFLVAAGASTLVPRSAAAQIKQPGRHPHYSVELEPHLNLNWDRGWRARGTGVGPGFRASIPFVHNGPIPQINNNIGISFGVDWAYFGECDGQPNSANCHVNQFWFPVVAQWNFFLTPIISVFGEIGGAIVSQNYGYESGCALVNNADCRYSRLDLFQPLFYGGGRFLFSDSIGMVVRLGSPSVTIGATFLL